MFYKYFVYACIAEAASAPKALKKEDSADGKYEDFLTAGVRTAQLVAAGARVASDVAGAVLTLCRSGIDDRDDQCGVSNAGRACCQLLGQPGAATASRSDRDDSNILIKGHFGPAYGQNFVIKQEFKAAKTPERKLKRKRPKKEEDAAWPDQCFEAPKR
jgi:hypothetical protein